MLTLLDFNFRDIREKSVQYTLRLFWSICFHLAQTDVLTYFLRSFSTHVRKKTQWFEFGLDDYRLTVLTIQQINMLSNKSDTSHSKPRIILLLFKTGNKIFEKNGTIWSLKLSYVVGTKTFANISESKAERR